MMTTVPPSLRMWWNTEEFVRIHAPSEHIDHILKTAECAVKLSAAELCDSVYLVACCYPLLTHITNTLDELLEPSDNVARIATRIVEAYLLGTGMPSKKCKDTTRMMWILAQDYDIGRCTFPIDILQVYHCVHRAVKGRTRSMSI